MMGDSGFWSGRGFSLTLERRAAIADVPGLELADRSRTSRALELDHVPLGRARRWTPHILEGDALRTYEHVDSIGFHVTVMGVSYIRCRSRHGHSTRSVEIPRGDQRAG